VAAGQSLIGREIGGRYEIVAELGAGGMATAYLAWDRRVSRQVVVKIPHEDLIRKPDFRKRFQREVRSLTQLQHPGVVPLYDSGEEPGLPYCVVRYLAGGDLAMRIEAAGGRLSFAEIDRWLPDLADTLDYVHRSGVIHRDVTPVNILFDEADNVFLSDFGVAAISHAADATGTPGSESRLTAEGTFVGAAIYAPPEAAQRNLTPAYDQYSLALVLYHALCGYLPFPQVEARALILAKNSEAPAPLDQRGVAIPASAVRAVMRGLSVLPEDRFPSCRELAEAFSGIGVDTRSLELPSRPSRRGRSRPGRWIAALVVAGVVAGGLLAAWLLDGGMRRPGGDAPAEVGEARPAAIAGTFLMGTTPDELEAALALCRAHGGSCARSLYADETPRQVSVGPFALDPTEVTNARFAAFVSATGHRTTAERTGHSRDGPFEEEGLDWRRPAGPRSSYRDLPEHPVVHVSAADAEAYCAHRGGRLPTEEEWEFAARGPERRTFPWGAEWNADDASWARDEHTRLHAVGRFPTGPFGHFDLAGNVWEWTATHQDSGRILRGGSWLETNPANLRAAVRLLAPASDSSTDIGFRCATDVAQ